jgi:hypothetical protein
MAVELCTFCKRPLTPEVSYKRPTSANKGLCKRNDCCKVRRARAKAEKDLLGCFADEPDLETESEGDLVDEYNNSRPDLTDESIVKGPTEKVRTDDLPDVEILPDSETEDVSDEDDEVPNEDDHKDEDKKDADDDKKDDEKKGSVLLPINLDRIMPVKSDLSHDDEPRLARIRAGIPVKPFAPSKDFVKLPPREYNVAKVLDIVKPFNLGATSGGHDTDKCSCLKCATWRACKDFGEPKPKIEKLEPDEAIRRKWQLEDQAKKHTPKAKIYGIDLEKISGWGGSLREKFTGMTERDVAAFTRHDEFVKTLGKAYLDMADVEMYRAVASKNYTVDELIATYGVEAGMHLPKVESLIIQHAFRIGLLALPEDFGKKPTPSNPGADDQYARRGDEIADEQDRDLRIDWMGCNRERP